MLLIELQGAISSLRRCPSELCRRMYEAYGADQAVQYELKGNMMTTLFISDTILISQIPYVDEHRVYCHRSLYGCFKYLADSVSWHVETFTLSLCTLA